MGRVVMAALPSQRTTARAPAPIADTIGPAEAAGRRWDVLVVGAGPAGAAAARACAGHGASVLLVDRARFPRAKVCGCCLGGAALAELARLGLSALPGRLGAGAIDRIVVASGGRRAGIRIPAMVAVSRAAFDAGLVREAVAAGARFLSGVVATLADPHAVDVDAGERRVALRGDATRVEVRAAVVLAADGLHGRLLDGDARFAARIEAGSRVGAAALLDEPPAGYGHRVLAMACAARGYVGLVRLECGSLDVAGAFDPALLREAGGPGSAAAAILDEAGFEVPGALAAARWWGTPLLTRRRRRVAAARLLVIGDAAGYVEPFTGEGIGWALASARAAAPLALRAAVATTWPPALEREWTARWGRLLRRRRRTCTGVARLLRHPRLTRLAVGAVGLVPALAAPVVKRVGAPLPEA